MVLIVFGLFAAETRELQQSLAHLYILQIAYLVFAMATAVLQPSDLMTPESPAFEEVEQVEHAEQIEQERVLGASTADQVLERWHGFMAETSKLLKSQLEPPAWGYRLPLSKVKVPKVPKVAATASKARFLTRKSWGLG